MDGPVRLTKKEAERCFPGAATAPWPRGTLEWQDFCVDDAVRLRPDIFDSYDNPNIRKSPDEIGGSMRAESRARAPTRES
jgi:hypothetical protein